MYIPELHCIVVHTVARARDPLGPRWGFTVLPQVGPPPHEVMPEVGAGPAVVMPEVGAGPAVVMPEVGQPFLLPLPVPSNSLQPRTATKALRPRKALDRLGAKVSAPDWCTNLRKVKMYNISY